MFRRVTGWLAPFRKIKLTSTNAAKLRFLNVSGKALAAGSLRDLPAASALPLTTGCLFESKLIYKTGLKPRGVTCHLGPIVARFLLESYRA